MSDDVVYFQLRISPRDRQRLETVARHERLSGPMWARSQLLKQVARAERAMREGKQEARR